MNFLVVVSGVPGSGKTFLGKELAARLALRFLDKDDFLDALFTEKGVGDWAWRQALSRIADDRFQQHVREPSGSVAVSFWRHPSSVRDAGTPSDWLLRLDRRIVELHCACSPTVARDRFVSRRRHPGHLDHLRDPEALLEQIQQLAERGPLGIGQFVVVVRTDATVDVAGLSAYVTAVLGS